MHHHGSLEGGAWLAYGNLLALCRRPATTSFSVGPTRGLVLELEANGQLEVQLHRGALVDAFHRVVHLDVDLGPVKGAIARIHLPLPRPRESIQRLRQLSLRHVPQRRVPQCFGWSRRQLQLVGHAKHRVDEAHEIQRTQHLVLDLVLAAEDVSIVLLEPAHARESSERPGDLVAVQHAEVRDAQRQLSVGADAVGEEQAVAGAVHGLHAPLLVLHVEGEHVVLVVLRVARDLPQLQVVDVGRDDFRIAALPVLVADERHKFVVHPCPMRHPEAAARGQLVEEEQFLLGTHQSMVPSFRLLLELLPLLEHALVWEGDAIDTLQRVVARLAQPVRGRRLGGGKGLDFARMRQVRPHAQVDEGSAPIHRCEGARWHFIGDERHLEGITTEHL
mmetsp:Transcript_32752/g.55219  ORF Transcript_32752/g.55219 Transcript_32752/m.55219 type:complete len:390 (+) Transcript_32752:512-1681(+)